MKSIYKRFLRLGSNSNTDMLYSGLPTPSLVINFFSGVSLFFVGIISGLLSLIFFLLDHLFMMFIFSFILIFSLLGLFCILLNGDYNNKEHRNKFRGIWFFIVVLSLLGLFLFNFLAITFLQPLVLTIGSGILVGLIIGAFILISGNKSVFGIIFGALTGIPIDSALTSPSLFKEANKNINILFREIINPVLLESVRPDENMIRIGVFFLLLTIWFLSLYAIFFEN